MEKTLSIPSPISQKQIDDLLTQAIEGGSGYWCQFGDYKEPAGFQRNENIHYHVIDCVFQGSTIEVQDCETSEKIGTLSLDSLESGIKLMVSKYPSLLASIVDGNWDAGDADTFLQLCALGEVVFG